MPGRPRKVEKRAEPQRHPHHRHRASEQASEHPGGGVGPEQVLAQVVEVEHHVVGHLLVLGEGPDESGDVVEVGRLGGTDHSRAAGFSRR